MTGVQTCALPIWSECSCVTSQCSICATPSLSTLCLPLLSGSGRPARPIFSKQDVEKLLAACDPATDQGLRDLAVILLWVRLGLRAGDVVHLRWGDIDWERGTLAATGKGRRQCLLPLPQDAGDAILKYAERGRPDVRDEHVFLRVNAPFVPLAHSSAVSSLVNRAARRAGLSAKRIGAHILRHTAATLMLRQGASLGTIANVLRHQSPDTTVLYAKVDVDMLSEIAQPWPGEAPTC